jgi:PAS domain S-box-containing protein
MARPDGSAAPLLESSLQLERNRLAPKTGGDHAQRDAGASRAPLSDMADIHRLLVASVRDYGIFVLDPEGHVATWNEGAERIKGYAPGEILGRHFSTFYPPEDLATGKPAMELRMAADVGRFEDEGWRLRKDGSRFWANVVITALRAEDGDLVGFAKVTRDLTERRASELQRVEDARRLVEAEAANRAKSEFLTSLSHELRTPLNAIGGYIDLLILGIHGAISEEQRVALERVRASQQHLLVLISDLLNFNRMGAGQIRYRIEPVPLAAVTATVRPMMESQAQARQLVLDWSPPAASVVAMADRPKVEQILLNLVSNALKFTAPGGTVSVRSYCQEDRAALEVRDTGVGIPADQLEAIFEPFTQVGRSLTSHHEGTGLGLAISRELARAMGGDLWAESEPGQGSTFTLTLPLADPEAP